MHQLAYGKQVSTFALKFTHILARLFEAGAEATLACPVKRGVSNPLSIVIHAFAKGQACDETRSKTCGRWNWNATQSLQLLSQVLLTDLMSVDVTALHGTAQWDQITFYVRVFTVELKPRLNQQRRVPIPGN